MVFITPAEKQGFLEWLAGSPMPRTSTMNRTMALANRYDHTVSTNPLFRPKSHRNMPIRLTQSLLNRVRKENINWITVC